MNGAALHRPAPADPAPAPRPHTASLIGPYRPGGRWERILRLTIVQPLGIGQLLDALDDGVRSRRAQRRKIHSALNAMRLQGLLTTTRNGHVPTAHGVRLISNPTPEGDPT